jgi:prophage tail gpP-like protein
MTNNPNLDLPDTPPSEADEPDDAKGNDELTLEDLEEQTKRRLIIAQDELDAAIAAKKEAQERINQLRPEVRRLEVVVRSYTPRKRSTS